MQCRPELKLYAAQKLQGQPPRQPGGNCGDVASHESGSLKPHDRKSMTVSLNAAVQETISWQNWDNLPTKTNTVRLLNVFGRLIFVKDTALMWSKHEIPCKLRALVVMFNMCGYFCYDMKQVDCAITSLIPTLLQIAKPWKWNWMQTGQGENALGTPTSSSEKAKIPSSDTEIMQNNAE